MQAICPAARSSSRAVFYGSRIPPLRATYATHAPTQARPQARTRSLLLLSVVLLGGSGWYWQQRTSSLPPLSYAYFTPLSVQSIEKITPDTSILSLNLPSALQPSASAYPEPADAPLQAIYIRQPELQIQRAYTPLSLECFFPSSSQSSHIRLLVKRYNDGEASSYIHRLKENDLVHVRGPVRTWTLPKCDHLVFIAGGTGLTPLAQLLTRRHELPAKITLVYATSTPETSLIPHIIPKGADLDVHQVQGRINSKHLQEWVGCRQATDSTHVVVCGPEGFIGDIAGPRSLNAAQDRVGGILGQLGWTQDNVKKL